MKKFAALFFLFALLCSSAWAANPDQNIIIVFTNDVHCAVDENIGYAGLAYYRDEMKKLSPYVALVDAGDWAQGGPAGAISRGDYVLEILNALHYDVAVPGNHEFDYGWAQFQHFAKDLSCGFISCNFRDMRNDELILKPYKIFSYGDVKVAFVGAATPETLTKSTPAVFMDENGNYIYDFDGETTGKKLSASIQKAVNDAKNDGADFVILVAHLGEYKDNTPVWSALFVVENTRGIDAVIDGHSHEITPSLKIKNLDGKEIPIVQTGTGLKNIGRVVIDTNGNITTGLADAEQVTGRDEKIKALVDEVKARYETIMAAHLTNTDFILRAKDDAGTWLVRDSETNLSDLVTDAMLYASTKRPAGPADFAIYNGGGIRTNILPGEILFRNAYAVLPFSNMTCIAEISGQTMLDELEVGARLLPNRNGGFLHVSGMTYTIDYSIPSPVILDNRNALVEISGPRRVKDVKVNGEDLDPEKIYKVVSISYVITAGGDGHKFKGARIIDPDFDDSAEVFGQYLATFEKLPERYKNSQGRIKIVGGNN